MLSNKQIDNINMLSNEQIDIINTIKQNKNVICDAVAGSGKTTTVLELAKALPDKLILQINKS